MKTFRFVGVLTLLLAGLSSAPAFAQPSVNYLQRLSSLETSVNTLTQSVAALQAANQAQAATITALQNALAAVQSTQTAQASSLSTLQTALNAEVANRKSYADSVAASALTSAKSYADSAVAPVADKLVHFSRSGNEIYITGANLNLRNGTGYTYNQLNGLGNLTIGYNDLRGSGDARTGSHNLILGFGNNYTAAGAFIGGAHNSSNGHMASVYGGTGNTASGLYAHISGGYSNVASGNWSNIGGGQNKVASTQLANLP